MDQKYLENSLIEVKIYLKKIIQDLIIMHMLLLIMNENNFY